MRGDPWGVVEVFALPAEDVLASGFPACVGWDEQRFAALEFDLQQADQPRRILIGSYRGRLGVDARHRQRVDARMEQEGHVEGFNGLPSRSLPGELAVDERPEGVVGARRQHGLANATPLGKGEGSAEEAGPDRRADRGIARREPDPDGALQDRVRTLGLVAAVAADPLSLPVVGIQEAHRPAGGLAPIRGDTVLVPDPHRPPADVVRRERLAGVRNVQRLIRGDLAGVPERFLTFAKRRFRARHADLVRRLAQPARVGLGRRRAPA